MTAQAISCGPYSASIGYFVAFISASAASIAF
ncbi:hypothetical protein AGROH133_14656 (plasmid) [Agrobacterium tumefaciens]|nr:hypothetical protein AGROH133_14656 [Agrobacterium tumefaciens]